VGGDAGKERLFAGIPEDIGDAEDMAGIARDGEEVIAEAIDIRDHEGFDEKTFFLEPDTASFGAAADAAGDVGGRDGGVTTG
jgi:hypothetical protein